MECCTWWDEWLSLSRWKVRRFLLPVSFKRKHVWCLITAWHLTVFSDQSDKVFFFTFYVGHLVERQQVRNIQRCHFPQAFQRRSFTTAINIRYHKCCAHFFLLFVFIFLFFFCGLTQSAETSSLPSELNWRKITFQCQKCQPPNLTAALPRCEPSTLHFSAVLRISSAGSASLLCFLPLGHCRYILLYSFRMCSTVNYQLYVILEEKRRARGKQQSHQSLWLHNSCHPYSNKIYHIVNHGEANVCECVCVRTRALITLKW